MINGKIIKVCGMQDAENIRAVESLGSIDMMGFIFYPPSPRCICELPAYLPTRADRVGVFVNEDKQTIGMYADRFGLDYVQLHGNESPEYCRSLRAMGMNIIKCFSIAQLLDLKRVAEYEGCCDLFLFDNRCEGHGGSGRTFDWTLLKAYNGTTPFLLSGGIGPHSIRSLQAFHHPQLAGYDLNSCFEVSPGKKDPERIHAFFNQLSSSI